MTVPRVLAALALCAVTLVTFRAYAGPGMQVALHGLFALCGH